MIRSAPAGFEPTNLDAVDQEELNVLAKVYETLSSYAAYRSSAMRLRADGLVLQAQIMEDRCDQLYKSLPEWAGW